MAPRKKRIVALGLLVTNTWLWCCLDPDHTSGLIYSEDEFLTSIQVPLLGRLALAQSSTWTMACELLAQGSLAQAQSVALIPVGQPNTNGLQALTKALQSALGEKKLLVSSDLLKTRSCCTQLLIVQPGSCSRSELAQLRQTLVLQGTTVAGWMIMDSGAEVV